MNELCELFKRACERKGFEVRENEYGVSGKMGDGTEIFISARPKRHVHIGGMYTVYGMIYRSDRDARYIDYKVEKCLYDKLKEIASERHSNNI